MFFFAIGGMWNVLLGGRGGLEDDQRCYSVVEAIII